MSRNYVDSCGDHYDTTKILRKWDVGNETNLFTVVVNGRNGNCIKGSLPLFSSIPGVLIKNMQTNIALMTAGEAVKADNLPTGSNTVMFHTLTDGGTDGISVGVSAAGEIVVRQGLQGTIIARSNPGVFTNSVWYFIETQVLPRSSATGTVTVRLNGLQVISVATVQTNFNGGSTLNQFGICTGVYTALYHDDIYVNDGLGTRNNTFSGDTKIVVIKPNAVGLLSQMTPSTSGADNYTMVDDDIPDDDSTYVSSATLNNIDMYGMSNLPADITNTYSVQWVSYMRKDDATSRTVKPVMSTDGATIALGQDYSLGQNYSYILQGFDVDPTDGTPWTPAKVNALQAGIKITS